MLGYLRHREGHLFDQQRRPSVVVGYAPEAYRQWGKEKKQLFLARNVKFDEESFPFSMLIQNTNKLIQPEDILTDEVNKHGALLLQIERILLKP